MDLSNCDISPTRFHLQIGENVSIVHYQFYDKESFLADLPLAAASWKARSRPPRTLKSISVVSEVT